MPAQLTTENVRIQITNWTRNGTHMIDKVPYQILKLDDVNWRLTTDPIQVNVNDPDHSGDLVTNCARYVSSNWLWQFTEDFTPMSIKWGISSEGYTARTSNGANMNNPPMLEAYVLPPKTSITDHQQFAYLGASSADFMGTINLQFTLEVRALPDDPAERQTALNAAKMLQPFNFEPPLNGS